MRPEQKYVDFKLNKLDFFKYLKVRLKEFLIDSTGVFEIQNNYFGFGLT